MQNNKIFTLGALALTLFALGTSYGLGKVPVAKPHLLPVETMPRQIGDWKAGEDRSVEAEVREKLPTARIVDRLYTNPQGQQIALMLVTADERDDIHNPTICFPSQGWQIETLHSLSIGEDRGRLMTAVQNFNKVDVFYWMTGRFAPKRPENALLRQVACWRDRMVGEQEGMSLFVRLMTNHTPQSGELLTRFADQIGPALQVMKAEGRKSL